LLTQKLNVREKLAKFDRGWVQFLSVRDELRSGWSGNRIKWGLQKGFLPFRDTAQTVSGDLCEDIATLFE
jgi:hypothetical protein